MASEIKVDTVSEKTSANGVTIDGVALKDGAVTATGVVTGTAFTAGSAVLAEAELELLDGLTAGTAIASKVVTTDASIDTSGQRNLTISGELDAATGDFSGAVDIAGATTVAALTASGVGQIATLGIASAKDLGVGIHIKTSDNSCGSVNAAADELIIENSAEAGLTILSGSSSGGTIAFGDQANNTAGKISYEHGNNSFQFYTNAEEHVRFQGSTQSISLNYGGTSVTGNVAVFVTGQASAAIMGMYHKDAGGGTAIGFFDGDNQACGSIVIDGNGNATAYNTSSDYRLKENVNYDFDATTELKKLKPAKFSWKSDSDSTVVEGFLAHEVSGIVPKAIQGTKDATETKQKVVLGKSGNFWRHNVEQSEWEELKNKTGQSDEMANSTWYAEKEIPIYQSIDQSKLVPLMVKTILELEARIKTLEAKTNISLEDE